MEVGHTSYLGSLDNLARSDFWFDDGNIILIAESAAFKVHRGQLERHSDVFRDLFSIPQPQVQNLVDGCQCVELHDCPTDIHHLLSALYDGLYFQEKATANEFHSIAGVLRLSTKYLIENLRQRCITRLEVDWPSTLAGWDRREKEAIDVQGRYTPREFYPHPILVINLALELGLDSLLSSALYDLSRYGPSKILLGSRNAKPVIPSLQCSPKEGKPTNQPVHLLHEHLRKVLYGREQSQRYIATFIDLQLKSRSVSNNCLNSGRSESQHCHESFYFIQLNILRSVGGIACGRDADPLYTLVQAIEMLTRTDFSDGVKQCGLKMCNACKVDFAMSVRKARGDVWASIPEWFELQDSFE